MSFLNESRHTYYQLFSSNRGGKVKSDKGNRHGGKLKGSENNLHECLTAYRRLNI